MTDLSITAGRNQRLNEDVLKQKMDFFGYARKFTKLLLDVDADELSLSTESKTCYNNCGVRCKEADEKVLVPGMQIEIN